MNRNDCHPRAAAAEDSRAPGNCDDIVADILQRIAAVVALPADVLARVDAEIRADWGGSREYIAKSGESVRKLMAARDAYIYAEHRRGEREQYLSRKFHISIKRIRQIVARARAAGTALV
jgi:Mor family transcriptional regulator